MATDSTEETPSAIFDLGPLASGDIVFVYDGSKKLLRRIVRYINVTGQRILLSLRRQEQILPSVALAKYSHVMLGLGSGLIIHADGKKVSIEIVSDALHHGTDQASLFRVYRRRNLSKEQGEEIARSAIRFYNKKYRFSPFFTVTSKTEDDGSEPEETDDSQFCSRLVAHAYRSVGAPVSELPDQKTLPIDLYRICQSEDWVDVSSEFIRQPFSAGVDDIMKTIDLPGLPKTTLSEFFERTDGHLREAGEHRKKLIEMHYQTTRHQIETEARLAQYCSLLFTEAKQVRLHPNQLDGACAERVARVLEQLEALLNLAFLPTIDAIVVDLPINAIDSVPGKGTFAGLPTSAVMDEMRRAREKIRIFTYFLLAELGLLIIIAWLFPNEKNTALQSAKPEFAASFYSKVQRLQDLTPYERGETLFNWVDDEDDRAICRTSIRNIVKALQVLEFTFVEKQSGSS